MRTLFVSFPHLPAERSKWIQPLLVLGGVAHHSVITTSSLKGRENKHNDIFFKK